MIRMITTRVRDQKDVVRARQRARDLASLMGFDRQDQVRVATAVSEIARNAFEYADGGDVEYSIENEINLTLKVVVSDSGNGVENLNHILSGRYESPNGMGIGIVGAMRLMDSFNIESRSPKGTIITLCKTLRARGPLSQERISQILTHLSTCESPEALDEVQEQNRDLLQALAELQAKSEELRQLNEELENTNRGVVALYGELDEKAEALRRANQLKTRFLSNITHEFRTPLGSMVTLSELLLDGADGPLNDAQANVVRLIRRSSTDLLELVNDLLDLAKVEAGKIPVKTTSFHLSGFLGALRLLMKPLASQNPKVELQFHTDFDCELLTDESKLTQILRNLISNALKYTPSGSVHVTASPISDGTVRFEVRDTGIGIAPEHLDRIFEEFVQIESVHQTKHKGTGLGLSLTQKLTHLLGGQIHVVSEPGRGSTFTVTVATKYAGPPVAQYIGESTVVVPSPFHSPASDSIRVLIVDDEADERAFLKQVLQSLFSCEILEVSDGVAGLTAARTFHPNLIFLDLNMPKKDGFETFRELRMDPDLSRIPVVIHSGRPLRGEEHDLFKGAAGYLSKTELSEESLLSAVKDITSRLGFAQRSWTK